MEAVRKGSREEAVKGKARLKQQQEGELLLKQSLPPSELLLLQAIGKNQERKERCNQLAGLVSRKERKPKGERSRMQRSSPGPSTVAKESHGAVASAL